MKHVVIMLFVLFLSGCIIDPVEEYKRNKTSKRLEGYWEITGYYIGADNVFDSLKNFFGDCWGKISFYGEYSKLMMHGDTCWYEGKYKLPQYNLVSLRFDRVEPFWVTFPVQGQGMQFALGDNAIWEILRLKKDELELRCTYFREEQRLLARKID